MKTRYFEMIEWSILQLVVSLFLILIYYFLCKNDNKKNIFQKSDIIITLILILIAGLRCNSGSDYYNYYFQYINVLKWYDDLFSVLIARFQNGYTFLAYLTNKFIGGQATIFIVVAIIIYFPLLRIMRKYSKSSWQSFALWLLLGYFSMSMNIIKQYLAMIFVIGSFNSYYKKKYFKYIIFSIIACFFHISAIYSLLCIPFSKTIRKPRKLYNFTLLASIISFFMFRTIILKIGIFIIPAKYYTYIHSWMVGDLDLKLRLGGISVTLFYIFIINLSIKKVKYLNKYYRMILNLSICMLPFLVFSIQMYILNRISYFGLQMLIIILPSILDQYKRRINKIFFVFILILYSLLFSILCAENNYYNYDTIFNSNPMSVREYVQKSLK